MGRKEKRIIVSLEHSPIRVGDQIVLETIGKKPPKVTLQDVVDMMNKRFDEQNAKWNKQEEFNKKVQMFMDNQSVFNNKVQKYMDSHP